MGGGMFLGLLEALLFGLARLLLALRLQVVGIDVLASEHGSKATTEGERQGAPARTSRGQGAGERIEANSIHGELLRDNDVAMIRSDAGGSISAGRGVTSTTTGRVIDRAQG